MLAFNGAPADGSNAIQTMRLSNQGEQPIVTPASRASRKRKSPPDSTEQQPQPPPQQQQIHHVLPPMMHPLPPGYHFTDFTPGGMPPPQQPDQQSASPPPNSAAGRALSSSKRAEQNRKAQRAFRERRDQHVKALESRSQLLDAALSSADEANRRWEECRALVDQLRVENAALRAALSQAQLLPPPPNPDLNPAINNSHDHGAQSQLEEATRSLEAGITELKPDSEEQNKND